MIDFGRDICGLLPAAERREWLITNGLGGYGSGTVAGLATRRYHGLLVAALDPPLGRTLLLAKLDETVTYDGRTYPISANRWTDGHIEPTGYQYLERFHLEGTTPVWTFACADALLEKRVWMQPGANTTYVRYDLVRGSGPLHFSTKACVDYRSHHGQAHAGDWRMAIEPVGGGLRVTAVEGAVPFYLLSERARATVHHEWYRSFLLSREQDRGLEAFDDNLFAGLFEATLNPGESLTLVASTEPAPALDGEAAYAERMAYEQALIAQSEHATAPPWVQQLVLAADQFIVQRPAEGAPDGRSVIAGYPWFGDWGRDTMISLAGLTLVTGRHALAAQVLRTFARFVDLGMLPNRFPGAAEAPEFNTADATLWYFEAIRATHAAGGDGSLPRDLYPVLEEIVHHHVQGTRYNIRLDPDDGLLYAGAPGVQLTWMDAKVDDWVVTPRVGKPVEINALWYNALRVCAQFARQLGRPAERYEALARRTRAGFARFWIEAAGWCYDVLDGPEGNDPTLRPNQLLAVSLPYSPLETRQQAAVVAVCARSLLTSHGLRSLAPDHPAYVPHYGGGQRQRDAAYHQGTVWAWLMGPFVSAHLRVHGDRQQARAFLLPLTRQLADYGVGSIGEIFDAEPPFTPRGCIAQAWSVAELLRAWQATAES